MPKPRASVIIHVQPDIDAPTLVSEYGVRISRVSLLKEPTGRVHGSTVKMTPKNISAALIWITEHPGE
jgi:hypothetical protein